MVLLCISNTVQNAIIGNDNSVTGGLLGATTLLTVNYVVVRFFFEHPGLDKLAEGDITVLVEDGKIIEKKPAPAELIPHTANCSPPHHCKQGISKL